MDSHTAHQVATVNVREQRPTSVAVTAKLLRDLRHLAEVRKHLRRNGVLYAEEWQAITGEDIRP
jgi:hypothetical protein